MWLREGCQLRLKVMVIVKLTVLVVPEGSREVLREDWELEGRNAPHVDHVTDDLTGFLRTISAKPA